MHCCSLFQIDAYICVHVTEFKFTWLSVMLMSLKHGIAGNTIRWVLTFSVTDKIAECHAEEHETFLIQKFFLSKVGKCRRFDTKKLSFLHEMWPFKSVSGSQHWNFSRYLLMNSLKCKNFWVIDWSALLCSGPFFHLLFPLFLFIRNEKHCLWIDCRFQHRSLIFRWQLVF